MAALYLPLTNFFKVSTYTLYLLAKMMAGYSILGFYPVEVMHSFKFIRT